MLEMLAAAMCFTRRVSCGGRHKSITVFEGMCSPSHCVCLHVHLYVFAFNYTTHAHTYLRHNFTPERVRACTRQLHRVGD